MADDNGCNGFRKFEEFVKESFKKILASLQKIRDGVITVSRHDLEDYQK